MAVVKKEQIFQVATELVAEYMNKGYFFNQTMRGHQGEEMKVDLTNGVETIRVYIDNNYRTGLEVIVERFDCGFGTDTLWAGKGEELYKKTFYKLEKAGSWDCVYFENEEEAKSAKKVQRKRERNMYEQEVSNRLPINKKVLNMVRNHKGFKTAKLNELICERTERGYEIYKIGNKWNNCLHFNF